MCRKGLTPAESTIITSAAHANHEPNSLNELITREFESVGVCVVRVSRVRVVMSESSRVARPYTPDAAAAIFLREFYSSRV